MSATAVTPSNFSKDALDRPQFRPLALLGEESFQDPLNYIVDGKWQSENKGSQTGWHSEGFCVEIPARFTHQEAEALFAEGGVFVQALKTIGVEASSHIYSEAGSDGKSIRVGNVDMPEAEVWASGGQVNETFLSAVRSVVAAGKERYTQEMEL